MASNNNNNNNNHKYKRQFIILIHLKKLNYFSSIKKIITNQ